MSKYVIDSSTLVSIADAIREKKGTSAPIQVNNFAQQISSIIGDGGVDVKTILESAKTIQYLNANGLLDNFYTQNSIILNLTPTSQASDHAFESSTLCDDITIDIDGTNIGSGSGALSNFMNNSKVKKLNLIIHDINSNFRYTNLNSFLYGNSLLEEINDDIFDFIPTMATPMTNKSSGIFTNCHNLKKLPASIYRLQIDAQSTSMYWGLSGLFNLRRMDIPICMSTNSNGFMVYKSDFSYLSSLEHFIITNPNNVQYTGAVSSSSSYLTLNLSNYVGYFPNVNNANKITDIADGTRHKVSNDEEYNLYKNTDYWTIDINYSHYNRTAAVETLQSLPDMSHMGFIFTIQFRGNSGKNTDGGAINTMTDEEIAIATNKNWTVQFV